MGFPSRIYIAVTAFLCLALTACGSQSGITPSALSLPQSSAASTQHAWMIGQWMVPFVESDPVASAAFVGAHPYIIMSNSKTTPTTFPASCPAPTSWQPVCIYRYASYATFAQDVKAHVIPSWLPAVMYDNEPPGDNLQTPSIEVQNPGTYFAKFCSSVKNLNKQFIGTYVNSSSTPATHQALQSAVIATATCWNGYQVQSQFYELEPSTFEAQITKFASAIHAVNPSVLIGYGLGDRAEINGTLEPMTTTDAAAIEAADASQSAASPAWMNFSSYGSLFPANPSLALQVIDHFTQ